MIAAGGVVGPLLNFSQRLSIRDAVAVARAKALAAGAFNVALGTVVGERFPSAAQVGAMLITGSLGYGLSMSSLHPS